MKNHYTEPHGLRALDALYGLLLSLVFGTGLTLWFVIDRGDLGSAIGDIFTDASFSSLADLLRDADLVGAGLGPAVWGVAGAISFQMMWIVYVGLRRNADPVQHYGIALRLPDLFLGVGLGLVAIASGGAMYRWVLPEFGMERAGAVEQFPASFADVSSRNVLALIVLVGLMVPVIEELFFRGFVLRSLQRDGGIVVAVVGSAVVYGLVHFAGFASGSYAYMALAAWLGLLFGAITAWTGRIAAATLAHVLNNTVVILVLTDTI
ncbi:MAG: CPBP family intramembrane metalloprotease [Acidimicrobiales bacterium]|nr:CPBP family intramembrane metalloprotease [Acidimicrobiales bacterium]